MIKPSASKLGDPVNINCSNIDCSKLLRLAVWYIRQWLTCAIPITPTKLSTQIVDVGL